MAKEINVYAPQNLLLDSSKLVPIVVDGVDVESNSNKELSKTNNLLVYYYELGYTLVFYKKAKLGDKNLLQMPIEEISSTEVINEKKRIGKNWFCVLKTTGDTIKIKAQEQQVDALSLILNYELQKPKMFNQLTPISFTEGGISKQLDICKTSPLAQKDEESTFEETGTGGGYVVTNYRVLMYPVESINGETQIKSLTHGEYEDVIATNVERKTETDSVGGVNSKSSMWNLVQNSVDISYNEETHHSSSVETEVGNIEFLNNGKLVMIWENFIDPTSVVAKIKSAKAHFKAPSEEKPSASSSEDPLQALKMRFVKGEISKEEFEEMKSMLE
tara:strand:- start:62 stop:1054 length:993 start_codon:yes stop_codon:yes gene_type:complete